jgi:rSAM/selenodomain-associated transferase 1
VQVFAKAPDPGRVKTRLAPALGEGGAAVLAARLARRAIETALAAAIGPVELWCAPDVAHDFFRVCARRHGVALRAQGDGDLGARMHRAMSDGLARHARCVLVGCDVPEMSPGDLAAAAEALAADAEIVLGPAEDGGYWLIGASAARAELFDGLPWGSDAVLDETRRRARAHGLSLHELPSRWDLDRPEDLARLRAWPGGASLLDGLREVA